MADDRVETEVTIWSVPHTVLVTPEEAAAWYPPDDYGNGTVAATDPDPEPDE